MGTEFTSDQYSIAYPDGIEGHHWHLARMRIVAREIALAGGAGVVATRRVARRVACKVLDIGAGRGIAVKYLRDSGIDCSGVELARAGPLAGAEPFIKYGCGAAELTEVERMRYEVILLLDVLEHLDDPDSFLNGILSLFPNCSLFIVTVPAGPKLWSNYDEFYGHRRRYTMEMIHELADGAGLKVLRANYFFRIFYLPALLGSALGMRRSCTVNAPRGIWRPLHRIIAAMSFIEYRALPKSMPGTSIAASLARTPGSLPLYRRRGF